MRPLIIDFVECRHIKVSGVIIKNSACWVQSFDRCVSLDIDGIRVESDAYWNNDGIDIVDTRNVSITNSYINASDDGICLKSHLKEYISSNLISKEIKINQQTNLNFSMKRNQPITITSNEQKVLVDQNEALKKEIFEFYKLCKNNRVKVPNLNESVYILEICKKIEKAIEKNL